jgi:hypothetical protein
MIGDMHLLGSDEDIRSDRDLAEDYRRGMEWQDNLIAVMQVTMDAQHAELVRLREYIGTLVTCPECDESEVCDPACALREQARDIWRIMDGARRALRGSNGP